MKNITLLILGLILVVNAFADSKKAITFEDFFAVKRLANLKSSSSGNYLAVEVTTPDIEVNVLDKSVLVLKRNGDVIQEFGAKNKKVKKPYISNDEKFVYFIQEKQIWRMQLDGSMPEQITNVYSGVTNYLFSPSENFIIIESEVYPDCEDQDCNKSRDEKKANNNIEARIYDHLLYRHWDEWRTEKRSHLLLYNVNDKSIKDMTPGNFDAPPIALGSDQDYAFSPDEKEICFVSNHDPMVAISTNNDVFILSITGGELQKISTSKANDTYPVYSPDGKHIAFLSMERAGFEADQKRIIIYNRNSKKLENLMTDQKLSAEEIIWSADSKTIYFTAQLKGYVPLFKLDIATKKITQISNKYFIKAINIAEKNKILFLSQSARSPYEIFSINLTNNNVEKISSINDELLSTLELSHFEEFWFDGANGDKVHGFIMKPPFFEEGEKYPAIEIIHGGPQGMMGDKFHYRWNTQMFAAPGYVVFWINFHGSTGYGQEFTDSISKHWGDLPFEDIMEGTQYVIDNYDYVDANRIAAAGASYGGTMINWICGHENSFKALVSHDGVYDQRSMWGATEELWFPEWELGGLPWEENSLYEKWSPARLAGNFSTPTLVIHGELDYRVPYTQGLQMFTALQRQGVPSKLLFFPDEDHWVQKPQNARLWWKTVLGWIANYIN